jgi:hypothetical protein
MTWRSNCLEFFIGMANENLIFELEKIVLTSDLQFSTFIHNFNPNANPLFYF